MTDWVDGELARKRNLVTDFGKIADPIADKALTGSALVGLSVLGQLWWWVTIAILVREIGITLLRLVVIRYGVIPASKGGKLKTVLQIVAITLFIVPGPIDPLRWAVMGAALLVTVLSGFDYVVRAWRLRRQAGR
jgi:CDP-diacylglycerol--glycerol-3-phosphate 3-phosphatidyltransferase